jgi:hypothetical protein
MDSKAEYVNNVASFFYSNKNKMTTQKDFEDMFNKYITDNHFIICRKSGIVDKKNENKNTPCVDMFYTEFNGQVYLLDKKNRVYTANKSNPLEIGYVEEKGNERTLVKYEEYKNKY